MPTTYTLIASNTLTSSAASVTFSSIPATYTDLVLRCTARSDFAGKRDVLFITFNGGSTYSNTYIRYEGATIVCTTESTSLYGIYGADGNTATASTFGNAEIYIPNYTSSNTKPMSYAGIFEDNTTTSGGGGIGAHLYGLTSAITSITIDQENGSNWLSGSSFFLYGVKKS